MRSIALKKVLKFSLAAAISLTIILALKNSIFESAQIIALAKKEIIAYCLALLIVYRVINASGWTLIIRGLGGKMNLGQGINIWLLSESFRWLPGSIWGFFSRASQGEKAGLKKSKASLSIPVELILTILAWAFTALTSGMISINQQAPLLGMLAEYYNLISAYLLPSFLVAAFLIIISLVILKTKKDFFIKKLKPLQDALVLIKKDISKTSLIKVFLLYLTLCHFNGYCFYLCCSALGFEQVSISLAISTNANVFLIGFFSFFAPGGIGVREAGITFFLQPILGLESAMAVAIAWRTIQLIGEASCLIGCLIIRELQNLEIIKVGETC